LSMLISSADAWPCGSMAEVGLAVETTERAAPVAATGGSESPDSGAYISTLAAPSAFLANNGQAHERRQSKHPSKQDPLPTAKHVAQCEDDTSMSDSALDRLIGGTSSTIACDSAWVGAGSTLQSAMSTTAVVDSQTLGGTAFTVHLEARAERAEMQLVRLQVNLAHSQSRQKDTNQLLERVSTQNTELRSQLAKAKDTIAELMHHREECELKHGWLLSTAAAAASSKIEAAADFGRVTVASTASQWPIGLNAERSANGSLEVRLEAASTECELRRRRCVELEAALADSEAWKRRYLELEGRLRSSPSTPLPAATPATVSPRSAGKDLMEGASTTEPASVCMQPAPKTPVRTRSPRTPQTGQPCDMFWDRVRSPQSSLEAISSAALRRAKEEEAADVRLLRMEREAMQFKVDQLERDLQGEKRHCGQLRAQLDLRSKNVWEAVQQSEEQSQAMLEKQLAEMQDKVAAAELAGESSARRDAREALDNMRSELADLQKARSSEAYQLPDEAPVPGLVGDGDQPRQASAHGALERSVVRRPQNGWVKPADRAPESSGASSAEPRGNHDGGEDDFLELQLSLTESLAEVERWQQETETCEQRRRQWESQCARQQVELDESKIELLHLRVKCGSVAYEDNGTSPALGSSDRPGNLKLKAEEIRRERAEQHVNELQAQREKLHTLLLDASTAASATGLTNGNGARTYSFSRQSGTLEEVTEKVVEQYLALATSAADLHAQFDSCSVSEDAARAELLNAQAELRKLQETEFSHRDLASREEDAARTYSSELDEMRLTLSMEQEKVSHLKSETATSSASNLHAMERRGPQLEEAAALRSKLQHTELCWKATREELAEARSKSSGASVDPSDGTGAEGAMMQEAERSPAAFLGKLDRDATDQSSQESLIGVVDAAVQHSSAASPSQDPSAMKFPEKRGMFEDVRGRGQREQNLQLPLPLQAEGRLSPGPGDDVSLGFSSRSGASFDEDAADRDCGRQVSSPTAASSNSSLSGVPISVSVPAPPPPPEVPPVPLKSPAASPPESSRSSTCSLSATEKATPARRTPPASPSTRGISTSGSSSRQRVRSAEKIGTESEPSPPRAKEPSPLSGVTDKTTGSRRSASSTSPPQRGSVSPPASPQGQLQTLQQAAQQAAQQRRAVAQAAAAADRKTAAAASGKPLRMATSPPKQRPFV